MAITLTAAGATSYKMPMRTTLTQNAWYFTPLT